MPSCVATTASSARSIWCRNKRCGQPQCPALNLLFGRHLGKSHGIVISKLQHIALSICRRCFEGCDVVEIYISRRHGRVEKVFMTENLRLARLREDDELVRKISPRSDPTPRASESISIPFVQRCADRQRTSCCTNARHQPDRGRIIGVLHQEFSATHQSETRAHFVPKLPLNVIQIDSGTSLYERTSARSISVIISSLVGP